MLLRTGGIVQGMTAAPHSEQAGGRCDACAVNDPTRGYGIFAENMLETAEAAAGRRAA
ncbi:MAG: SpoIVB peptidase S55 domain-containing protein [Ruthenibacterium sp.]